MTGTVEASILSLHAYSFLFLACFQACSPVRVDSRDGRGLLSVRVPEHGASRASWNEADRTMSFREETL